MSHILIEYLGGSHSYGLDTSNSDQDIRGVFIHTDFKYAVGMDRDKFDVEELTSNGLDKVLFEVRKFICLLRKGNTQCVETLFIQNPLYVSKFEWSMIEYHKKNLLDTQQIFKSVMGYAQSERLLFMGSRTGKLGGKRQSQVEQHGYSPKNYVQLMRLLWATGVFIDTGVFPVNISHFDSSFRDELLDVKVNPANHNKEKLLQKSLLFEEQLKEKFNNRNINNDYVFSDGEANHLLRRLYSFYF